MIVKYIEYFLYYHTNSVAKTYYTLLEAQHVYLSNKTAGWMDGSTMMELRFLDGDTGWLVHVKVALELKANISHCTTLQYNHNIWHDT